MPQLLIHSETGETSTLAIADTTITIGRRRTNSLCLPHLSVSGHHAQILHEKGCLIIEDLQSTNGTIVNGENISRQVLTHLDDIIIGSYHISYSETYTAPISHPNRQNVTALPSIMPIIDPAMVEAPQQKKAILKVNSGAKAGRVVALEKPITTVGKAGGDLGAISKKPTGYYFIPMSEHETQMKHNGHDLMAQVEVKLMGGDLLEIGGEQLVFVHPYYE